MMRRLGLADIRAGLASGEFSAVELVQDRLAALEAAAALNAADGVSVRLEFPRGERRRWRWTARPSSALPRSPASR